MEYGLIIVKSDLSKNFGIRKKMEEISKELSKKYIIILIYNYDDKIKIIFYSGKETYKSKELKCSNFFKQQRMFFEFVNSYIKKENLKFVYIRYIIGDFFLYLLMKIIKNKGIKLILDIPVYPFKKEVKGYINKIRLLINSLLFEKQINLSDIIISTSQNVNKLYGKKIISIFNGVNVKDIPFSKRPPLDKTFKMIGIANLTFWQGFDRVIKGIYEYKEKNGEYNIMFHIVGNGNELKKLKKLSEQLRVNENVMFHGYLTGKLLDDLFNDSHIAIGTLGRHRTNVFNISTLKASEYIARGIPFVSSVNELAFPKNFKYIIKVEPDDTAINLYKIIDVYKSFNKDDFKSLRDYAETELSWESALKNLREYL